jgi:hypothetical protein
VIYGSMTVSSHVTVPWGRSQQCFRPKPGQKPKGKPIRQAEPGKVKFGRVSESESLFYASLAVVAETMDDTAIKGNGNWVYIRPDADTPPRRRGGTFPECIAQKWNTGTP